MAVIEIIGWKEQNVGFTSKEKSLSNSYWAGICLLRNAVEGISRLDCHHRRHWVHCTGSSSEIYIVTTPFNVDLEWDTTYLTD